MACICNDGELRVWDLGCIRLSETWRSQCILLTDNDECRACNTCKQISRISPPSHTTRCGCNTLHGRGFDHLTHTHFHFGVMLACVFRKQAWHLEVSDCSNALRLGNARDVFAVGLRLWCICAGSS